MDSLILLQSSFSNWFPAHLRGVSLIVIGCWMWFFVDRFLINHGIDSLKAFQCSPSANRNSFAGIALALTILYIFNLFIFLENTRMRAIHCFSFYPLLVVFSYGLLIFCPFNICYRRERYTLIKCFARILFGGMTTPVCFADTFLADILTSYAKVMADFEILICYSINGCNPLIDRCLPSFVSALLISFPFVIRLKQCILQYLDSGSRKNLVNAAKYMTAFPVIYLSFALRSDAKSWQLFYAWLLFAFVQLIFTFIWDMLQDWDLGHPSIKKEFPYLLRKHLSFENASFYYSAAILNLVLRAIWMLKVYMMSESSPYALLYFSGTELFIYSLNLLEILRRFIWSLFRIEAQLIKLNDYNRLL